MYTISKTFTFEAAHSLVLLPPTHKCHGTHGHSYNLTLTLQSETLDRVGFVVDYGEGLSKFEEWLDATLDHKNLNEEVMCPTTVEHLAKWVFDQWKNIIPQLVSVRLSETPKTWAEYRP